MKSYKLLSYTFFSLITNLLMAQTTEIEGAVKIFNTPTNNNADQVLVRQADGTIAQRNATTIASGGALTVSLTGDTLFQGTAGFVIIPGISAANTVRYRMTYNSTWSQANHPTDFPFNPHFSSVIGMTHSVDVKLFEPGTLASLGIKNVAEFGSTGALNNEINNYIGAGTAQSRISGGGISLSPGSVSTEFNLTNSHPLVSMVTMVAPSPDWFVGIRAVSLLENGTWVQNKTVNIGIYDSGTDSGATYTSSNQPTNPPVPVFVITDPPLGDGNSVPSMGTVTFERIDN